MVTYKIYEQNGKEYKFNSIIDARKKAHAMVKKGLAWVEIFNYDMRDWHYPDGYSIGEVYRHDTYTKYIVWRANGASPVILHPSGKV